VHYVLKNYTDVTEFTINAGGAMLGLVKSSIGTKFTGQFGDLIAVSIFLPCGTSTIPPKL
jgi:hypothetical protein